MSDRIKKRNTVIFLVLVIVASVFGVGGAKAAALNMPQTLPGVDSPHKQYENLTNTYSQSYTGTGAVVPNGAYKIYTSYLSPDLSGSHKVKITFYNVYGYSSNCTGYGIGYDFLNTGPAEDQFIPITNSDKALNAPFCPNVSDGSTTFTLNIPDSYFSKSTVPEHSSPQAQQLYTVALQLIINPTTTQSAMYTLDTSFTASTYIGYLNNLPATVYPEKASDTSKGYNTLDYTFRPSCDLHGEDNFPLRWGDDDYGTQNQDTTLVVKLYVTDDSGNTVEGPYTLAKKPDAFVSGSGGLVGFGSDGQGAFFPESGGKNNLPGGVWNPHRHYKLEFQNVQGGNGIEVTLPFDSGDYGLNCPSPIVPVNTGGCYSATATDSGDWFGYKTYTQVTIDGNGRVGTLAEHNADPFHVQDGQLNPYPWDPDPSATYTFDPTTNEYFATKTWNYVPNGRTVTVTKTRYALVNGVWTQIVDAPGNPNPASTTYNCFTATCSITSVDGDFSNGGAIAGNTYTAHVNLSNPGPPDPHDAGVGALTGYYYFSGWRLGVSGTGGDHVLGYGLNVGDSGDIPVTFRATSTGPVTDNLSFTPYYTGGGFQLGAPCAYGEPVYAPFHLSLNANAQLVNSSGEADNESPTGVKYFTSVDNSVNGTVNVPTNNCVYYYREPTSDPVNCAGAVIGPVNQGSVGGGTTYPMPTATRSPLPVIPYNAGDTYCGYIHADFTTGYVGPSGDVVDPRADNPLYPPTVHNCDNISNEPYVHFVGSGVSAGGDFEGNNTCTSTAGAIHTYSKASGQVASVPRGSGSQFGASALGIIEGLSSANLRTGSPTANIGLSFANTVVNSGSGSPAGAFGGNLGVYGSCLKDYFGAKPDSTSQQIATATTAGVSSGAQYYKPPSMFTLTAGSLANGVNQTIYVEGKDVYINQSSGSTKINYAGANGWTSLTDIPSFMLVVKGGNIYIDKSITQLDGIYVAQASGGMGGTINTCATGTGGLLGAQIYGSAGCNKQLVVNGAFVANKIFLNRSYSSLRYSTAGENPFYNPLIHPCGNAGEDVPVGATSATDCAAEIFNFSPEMYLAQPDIDASHGPTKPVFDYVTSLSPVL